MIIYRNFLITYLRHYKVSVNNKNIKSAINMLILIYIYIVEFYMF